MSQTITQRVRGGVVLLLAAVIASTVTQSASAHTDPHAPEPRGKATITVHDGGSASGPVRDSATLNCFPTSGTHPRPHHSCRLLDQAQGNFAKLTPDNRPCVLIYDPVTVVAQGTWDGEPTAFTRTYGNQCAANGASGGVFNLHPWQG
ncbi:SSI family serine proteinase inhibitor [Nonomuraea sp. NPDC050310]|uniref:SSI family serine proteinase inhibitor n=1 Tax=Nonomuraea sp. NPDC050310 TaxID=3154935 RepID=UPI0033D0F18D